MSGAEGDTAEGRHAADCFSPDMIRRLGRLLARPNKAKRRDFGRFMDIVKFDPIKLAYITVPKTANTSIKHALANTCGLLSQEEAHQLKGEPQKIHAILRTKKNVAISEESLMLLEDYTVMSTVRHPVDRFLSFYKDKIIGDGWGPAAAANVFSVYDFTQQDTASNCLDKILALAEDEAEIHFRPQANILVRGETLLPDQIYKFEQLDYMWEKLSEHCDKFGLDLDSTRQHHNRSSAKAINLSDGDINKLHHYYARVFDLFYF